MKALAVFAGLIIVLVAVVTAPFPLAYVSPVYCLGMLLGLGMIVAALAA